MCKAILGLHERLLTSFSNVFCATATNCFLCESEATATKCFLCESEATATNVFCAKAKRQQQQQLRQGEIDLFIL